MLQILALWAGALAPREALENPWPEDFAIEVLDIFWANETKKTT